MLDTTFTYQPVFVRNGSWHQALSSVFKHTASGRCAGRIG